MTQLTEVVIAGAGPNGLMLAYPKLLLMNSNTSAV